MLQCGTCSGPKTIGLTCEKLGIWPVLIDKTSNYSIPKVGVQLPRTGSRLPDAGSGQEFFMENWQGGCCWEKQKTNSFNARVFRDSTVLGGAGHLWLAIGPATPVAAMKPSIYMNDKCGDVTAMIADQA